MSSPQIALETAIGLMFVWLLLFCAWRSYRVDLLRRRLFELRDELFDYAAEGKMDFSEEYYIEHESI